MLSQPVSLDLCTSRKHAELTLIHLDRYIALQNDDKGHGPLSEYFKGETLHTDPNTDLWTKNMFVVLCLLLKGPNAELTK